MTCEILGALRYRTVWAVSAAVEFDLLASQDSYFDLAFSDVSCPA